MTYKKYQTVGTVPKFIIKITERGTIDDPQHTNTWRSLSWPDTDTSVKSDGVKLVLLAQIT